MQQPNFYSLIQKIDDRIEGQDFYIENEEIETILKIAFPDYQVFYSDNCQDFLDEIQANIIDHTLVYDDLKYDYIMQSDVYFMIQKIHKKGENK